MGELTLFDVRPPSANEQAALPLRGTIAGAYAAWRGTAEGARLFDVMRWRALALVRAGEGRVSVKGLVEWCRAEYKQEINNSHTSLIARELLQWEPELHGKIECRQRNAT
jgi:hypothetical protein